MRVEDSHMPNCLDFCFFFNDTATTEIYTLSLHDALPICPTINQKHVAGLYYRGLIPGRFVDRKSTRLNSSHLGISYAVFCLKKQEIPERTTGHVRTRSGRAWSGLRLLRA